MKKYIFILLGFLLPFISSAHVAYVAPENSFSKHGGTDWSYFAPVLHNSFYIFLIIFTTIIVIVAFYISRKVQRFRNFFDRVEERLSTYHEFIPWIMRLGLGIALIGSGTEHSLISPVIKNGQIFSTLEILLGFFFLIGFMLVPTAILTIGLYLSALTHTEYIIGNLDMLGLAIGVLVFHSSRPGLDDILNTSLLKFIKINRKWLSLILRLSVGIAMIYLAIYEKLLNPHVSDLVIKMFHLDKIIPVSPEMWVFSVAIIEILVGLFILIGFFTRTAACIAIIVLSFSFFFFKESVASHVSLFSILAIVAIEGGTFVSIDKWRKALMVYRKTLI